MKTREFYNSAGEERGKDMAGKGREEDGIMDVLRLGWVTRHHHQVGMSLRKKGYQWLD